MTDTAITRVDPPFAGSERTLLTGFLDYLRDTIVLKSSGLSEQDAHRGVVPSPLTTVAGLVSHLRWVEEYWFEKILAERPDRAPYHPDDPDREFRVAAGIDMPRLFDGYARQCAISREIVAGMDLDREVPFRGGVISPRWVLIHMIEETARHAGQLDILREMLDGVTGE